MDDRQAWNELLDALKGAVPPADQGFRWIPPDGVYYGRVWSMQARLENEAPVNLIVYEKFVAGEPSGYRRLQSFQLELSHSEAFWRFLPEQTVLKSGELAKRIVSQLREFHDEYGIHLVEGRAE